MEDEIIFNIDVMLAKRKMSGDRAFSEGGNHDGKHFHPEKWKGQGREGFHAGKALSGAGLSAGGPSGIPAGRGECG